MKTAIYFAGGVAIGYAAGRRSVVYSGVSVNDKQEPSRSFLGFDHHGAFNSLYPGLLADCTPMVTLMDRANAHDGADDFEGAIGSLLPYCWELSVSIVKLVQTGLPTSAIVQARALYEAVMSTLYLIAHPEKLGDFIDHAEYIETRVRVAEHGNEPKSVEEFAKRNGSAAADRYRHLKQHFGRDGWHRLKVDKLAEATGFDRLHPQLYRETSTIAHGGSIHLLTPRTGIGTAKLSPTNSGRDYATLALMCAMVLSAIVARSGNAVLKLGCDRELEMFEASLVRRGWW
jgi:hypothetical protein